MQEQVLAGRVHLWGISTVEPVWGASGLVRVFLYINEGFVLNALEHLWLNETVVQENKRCFCWIFLYGLFCTAKKIILII